MQWAVDGGQFGVTGFGECFVETCVTYLRLARHIGHALRQSYLSQGEQKHDGVFLITASCSVGSLT